MDIISEISVMQARCLAARVSGQRIAFVPTMGFLHEGHESLLREGRQQGDLLVLSVFVNPTQFGPNEDLARYPRNFTRDEELARQCGVDLLFYPSAEEIYPSGFSTWVEVAGPLTTSLEGASRPGHFRGVATVVAKLLAVVQPHLALFGRKDFQQLAVIQRMARDLNLPVSIIGLPTVREADGLAMSSRNVYLSAEERRQALSLIAALRSAREVASSGEVDPHKLIELAKSRLRAEPDLSIDYVAVRHQLTLEEVEYIDTDSVMLLAARVGSTRLIDNAKLLD